MVPEIVGVKGNSASPLLGFYGTLVLSTALHAHAERGYPHIIRTDFGPGPLLRKVRNSGTELEIHLRSVTLTPVIVCIGILYGVLGVCQESQSHAFGAMLGIAHASRCGAADGSRHSHCDAKHG